MLEIKNLSVNYGSLTIVDRVSFHLAPGEWLMIVGPNGAGKSTLINAIAQTVPYKGKVLFKNTDAATLSSRQFARKIGMLSQNNYISYSFTVEEVVRLGRYAYSSGIFSGSDKKEDELIKQALEKVGLTEQAHQSVLTLSGGELQRTFLAQLLAQDPEILLLDEPTNHLDLVYQQQLFSLISHWLSQGNRSVISVVHDLSLARAYGTKALLMNKGKIAGYGLTKQTLNRQTLQQVYNLDVFSWMKEILSQWEE